MTEHKHKKFNQSNNNTFSLVRQEALKNGSRIIFMIAGTSTVLLDLADDKIDFDFLSDEKIKEIENMETGLQITFIWDNITGFVRQ